MALDVVNFIKPDSYLPSIYDIKYPKLYENGIRYAVFDVDCTLLPFDDVNVTEENKTLFRYLKMIGINSGLCSSGFDRRVRPVAEALDVNYIAKASKPFVSFDSIRGLFDEECRPDNTVMIGDSLFLDMALASKNKMYKILVDMIRDNVNFAVYANDVIQAIMYTALKTDGFKWKKYYRGNIER